MQTPGLGNRLLALRLQRGWSQRKLAVAAGISNATVSRIESGALTGVSVTVVSMLAAALECDLSLLLVGTLPTRKTVSELSNDVYRALIALSAPGKKSLPYPLFAADLDCLRRTRVAGDFVQVLAIAPPILRSLAIGEQPDETTHACYDVALALRMLRQNSAAWIAIGLARQAAETAEATAALVPIVIALQSVFAIEDGELPTAISLIGHAEPAIVDSPQSAAGQATLALIEGLTHAHSRCSDGSDQVTRARQLLHQADGRADILGTGIFRPADLDLWHMKIAIARHELLTQRLQPHTIAPLRRIRESSARPSR